MAMGSDLYICKLMDNLGFFRLTTIGISGVER